jgi:hypothetical protein
MLAMLWRKLAVSPVKSRGCSRGGEQAKGFFAAADHDGEAVADAEARQGGGAGEKIGILRQQEHAAGKHRRVGGAEGLAELGGIEIGTGGEEEGGAVGRELEHMAVLDAQGVGHGADGAGEQGAERVAGERETAEVDEGGLLDGALGEGAFRLVLFGDVDARADIADENPVFIVPGHAVVEDPAIGAVVPPQTVDHPEGLPGFAARDEHVQATLRILGMHAGDPAVGDFLGEGAAGEIEPRAVDIGEFPRRIGHPDQHGRRVGHRAEAGFALAQGGFGLLAFGDIVTVGVDLVLGGEGRGIPDDVTPAAVAMDEAAFAFAAAADRGPGIAHGRIRGEQTLPPGGERLAIVGMHEGHQRPADELGAGETEPGGPGGIDLLQGAAEIGEAEEIGRQLEQLLVFALEPGLFAGDVLAFEQRGDRGHDVRQTVLQHVVDGAAFHAFDGGFLAERVGEHDDRRLRTPGLGQFEDLQPVEVAQKIVGDDEVGAKFVERADILVAGRHTARFAREVGALQLLQQQLLVDRRVFVDEDAGQWHRRIGKPH